MFATTLTTERLLLRPPTIDDAPAIFERYAADPLVTRYLSWETHRTIDDTHAFLDGDHPLDANWSICLEGDPTPCGMVGAFDRGHKAIIGYVLSRDVWGRGVATEAAKAVIDEIWKHDRIYRVQADCHVDNLASARVLEKCGLVREAKLRRWMVMPQIGDEPQDCYLHAQVRDDLGR